MSSQGYSLQSGNVVCNGSVKCQQREATSSDYNFNIEKVGSQTFLKWGTANCYIENELSFLNCKVGNVRTSFTGLNTFSEFYLINGSKKCREESKTHPNDQNVNCGTGLSKFRLVPSPNGVIPSSDGISFVDTPYNFSTKTKNCSSGNVSVDNVCQAWNTTLVVNPFKSCPNSTKELLEQKSDTSKSCFIYQQGTSSRGKACSTSSVKYQNLCYSNSAPFVKSTDVCPTDFKEENGMCIPTQQNLVNTNLRCAPNYFQKDSKCYTPGSYFYAPTTESCPNKTMRYGTTNFCQVEYPSN